MRRIVGWAVALFMLGAIAVSAQDIKEKFTQTQRANAQTLRQYGWESRTEIRVDGESKNYSIERVRYDIDGKLQKTKIGGSPEQQPSGRRVKRRIIRKKKKQFAEMMQKLGALLKSYSQLPPEKMKQLAATATFAPGSGKYQGTVHLKTMNIIQPGDTLNIWIDKTTMMMRRVEIRTFLDKKPVSAISEYKGIPDGPTFQARSTVEYPAKNVQMIVENFNYRAIG